MPAEVDNKKASSQFSLSAKWLHWLVVFFMYSLLSNVAKFWQQTPAERGLAIPPHVAVGLIILVLTFVRLAVRKANPPPHLPATTPKWMHAPAKMGHFLLYAIFLYMALIGIWMAAISPVDIRIFSAWNLSALAPANPELLAVLRKWHFAGAVAMLAVLVGHIGAALWHHVILKDNVLTRMLPFSAFAGKAWRKGAIETWRFPTSNGVDWHDKATWFRDNRA